MAYSPGAIEGPIYERWEASGVFSPKGLGEPYCIVIPPPNVTGTLHMGHAFQHTVMDSLTRYHRMRGHRALWQPGTDHAGIATQMVVERLLDAEGSSRHDLGRDAFVDRVWQWKEQSGNTISEQMRRMGVSVDWQRDRFTMDPGLSDAVLEVFVRLYDEGLIYRGQRLVNWDPILTTALSDLEVLASEEKGHLWHFRYPLAGSEDHLVVATTRPETMLGDTAVAVHPEDERYAHLVGKHIALPLTEREIPIIADDYVDPEFGTGCVKITPAHDFNDYEIGQRHDLALINVLSPDASMNDAVPDPFRGLDRFEARKAVVAALEEKGLLERIDDHVLMVPRGDRSGAIVEPYLTDQWYVRTEPLAKPALDAVESGKIRFVPENWDKTYYEWMRNIQDWCISRQLWWGHRIPAWYDDDGNIYVGKDEADARRRGNVTDSVELRQDEDVLDTWFSSALWPFSTLGWPEETDELKSFYPTSVLVTGFDIIFFWVARMIMMGLKFAGDVPFREIYITGLIRDEDGQKMSKSKGNILDPIDLVDGIDLEQLVAKRTQGMMQPHLKARIEKATRKQFPNGIPAFGTDALRFTFAALATTGRDIRFDLGRIEGYRNFCNKLWNASQFVFNHVDAATVPAPLDTADRWIESSLRRTLLAVERHYQNYRFDLAAQAVYEFVWHEFCDWYIELSKPGLGDETHASAAPHQLARVLDATLRMIHPTMPYITESLWQSLNEKLGNSSDDLLIASSWPNAQDFHEDLEAESEVAWIREFVGGIRQIRGEMDISPRQPLTAWLDDPSATDLERAEKHRGLLTALARLDDVGTLANADAGGWNATALVGSLRIVVPLTGIKDPTVEKTRLGKVLGKLESDWSKASQKLTNPAFVDKAPAEIVAKERVRATELDEKIKAIRAQIDRLG